MMQVWLFVGAGAILLLGAFVLINNPRSTLFRAYFLFSLLAVAWVLVNALTMGGVVEIRGEALLFLSRLITPFSLAASLSFLYFLEIFKARKLSRADLLIALPSVIIATLSFSRFNVHLNIAGQTVLGGLYPFYLAAIVLNSSAIFYVLYAPSSIRSFPPSSRIQMIYLKMGALGTLVPAVGFGAVLPLFSSSKLVNLSPVFSLVFLLFAGLAIIRHRLFDLRLVVVRAAAYFTTLFVMTVLVVAPVVLVFGYFLHFQPSLGRFITVVLLSVSVLYVLQYVRQFFDKFTTRIFFRHYYDLQDVLDKLSDVLVHTADVAVICTETAAVLKEALKPGMLQYALFANESEDGAGLAKRISAHSFGGSAVIVDVEEAESKNGHLAAVLKSENIALVVRLRTTHEDLGYIVLGHKQSGEIYTDRDRRLLSVAADEIAISLQNALRFQEIQNFNATLQKRVEDATRRLRESNKRLKMLDETKDDFISMASHQLRTPLTSVKGYISLVLDGDAGSIKPQQRKLLTQAFISSQRMVYLIADLLNVSRLKTGKFVIEPSPVNLADIVQDEISQLVETAKGRQLTLAYHKPAHFPLLNLDETKIRQVIMNFADNAIYYTPSGGHIDIQLIDKPKSIELRVVDDGIGVPKDEQHHLFTKFYRAKNAQRARPDGTGLGLFMAQKVVMAQGGAVIFSSKENKGSTFGFTFPKEKLQTLATQDKERV